MFTDTPTGTTLQWCECTHLGQVRQQRNALDGLAQPHLVSQDAVDALAEQDQHRNITAAPPHPAPPTHTYLVVEVGQPVHSLELVCLELALEHGRLGVLLGARQTGVSQTEVEVNYTTKVHTAQEGGEVCVCVERCWEGRGGSHECCRSLS